MFYCLGDVFGAPPAKIILRTIKELAIKQPDVGAILIVRNTTGNRLSFGLAKERAANDGIKVHLICVNDDCYVSQTGNEKRGITGLILICKIAGAMAEANKKVQEIFEFCQEVQQQMFSILLCLDPHTSPTIEHCICVKHKTSNEIEIGTGLHGEPGIKKVKLNKLSDICTALIEEITTESQVLELNETSEPIVLLVNNLGTITKTEELLFLRELVKQLHGRQVKITRVYCGRYYTSLSMAGLSVTILRVLNSQIIEYLDAPCEATGKFNCSHFIQRFTKILGVLSNSEKLSKLNRK